MTRITAAYMYMNLFGNIRNTPVFETPFALQRRPDMCVAVDRTLLPVNPLPTAFYKITINPQIFTCIQIWTP